MFELIVQFKVKDSSSQESFTIELKSMPSVGDYVQYKDGQALEVKRVYHIPKVIEQQSNGDLADAILFVDFIDDLTVSKF